MSRPPRPHATTAVETVFRHDAVAWSSPGQQFPQGFEDPEARRGDGTEFADDMSQAGAMGSGSYFTDLVNGVEESQDFSPTTDTPIDHGLAAAKGSQGTTKNFSDEEDRLVVSAWLNVSMDAIQGVDQSQISYWARIHEYFHANKSFESDRSQGSLMNRWSTIQHDVNIFFGCVTRIEDRNQSGSLVDDKAEDKKNRKFALMHCSRILKDKPKWMERRKQIGGQKTGSNKKQKTKANSSPSSAAPVLAPGTAGVDATPAKDPSKRPDGNKMEKKKLRQRSTIEALNYLVAKMKEADAEKDLKKEERCNKAFALQEKKIKLEREKFEFERELEREKIQFQKELEEERILSLDLSNMSYRQQQYYEGR
ncbi:glutathione S-transferase T3-like [Panicum miliaceum]|uniref:Glutathione S-transferase T3-like n=1 Tax=Panicum miliaceum TaxID=4540 RepID=A0A3L6T515_PANMI|nr:glutathione S-transferase T3-like [Panicum miliaceum]